MGLFTHGIAGFGGCLDDLFQNRSCLVSSVRGYEQLRQLHLGLDHRVKSVVTTTGGAVAFSEGTAVTVDGGVTLSDTDDSQLTGATVSITANRETTDVLTFTLAGSITGSYNGTTGILTLSGTDSVANYQSVLQSVQFNTTSENPSELTRTITMSVTDNNSAGLGDNMNRTGSNTRNLTVTRINKLSLRFLSSWPAYRFDASICDCE